MDPNLFTRLQQEFNKSPQELSQIDGLLCLAMVQLSTMGIGGSASAKDNTQIQQVLEMGAFWSVHSKDQASFQRYISLLFPIYLESSNDKAPVNAPMYSLLGLHLLSLLVSNRVADFYV